MKRDEVSLGELIHQAVRRTIEQVVEEELPAALGLADYERSAQRSGYRHGAKTRTLMGPTGPVELTVPRGRLTKADGGTEEFCSTVLPRYQRRMREIKEAVAGVYLRIRGALRPLLKNAPLSKSAVSRIVGTLRGDWETWRKQPLKELNVVYLYLDAIALRVRSAGKVTGLPVLLPLRSSPTRASVSSPSRGSELCARTMHVRAGCWAAFTKTLRITGDLG